MFRKKAGKGRNASRDTLKMAREAIEKGDLVKASQQGWDAAACAVKSVPVGHDWTWQEHRELFLKVSDITRRTGDRRVLDLFLVACSLESNANEDWMPKEMVKSGLDGIEELIGRLEMVQQ